MKLRPIDERDMIYVSVLLDTAFGGPEEFQRMKRVRETGAMAMELVAERDDGTLIGYISFVRHVTPDGWWALALEAVNRGERGHGVGSKLVAYGVDAARQAGAKAVTVVGEPRFYKRFGFSDIAADKVKTPFEHSATLVYPIDDGTGGAEVTLAYPKSMVAS